MVDINLIVYMTLSLYLIYIYRERNSFWNMFETPSLFLAEQIQEQSLHYSHTEAVSKECVPLLDSNVLWKGEVRRERVKICNLPRREVTQIELFQNALLNFLHISSTGNTGQVDVH